MITLVVAFRHPYRQQRARPAQHAESASQVVTSPRATGRYIHWHLIQCLWEPRRQLGPGTGALPSQALA